MRNPFFFSLLGLLSLALAARPASPIVPPPLSGGLQLALAAVNADDLKGDLSFLASDALQGRFTPSPGLEIAAEFIAAKFRAAGFRAGGRPRLFSNRRDG